MGYRVGLITTLDTNIGDDFIREGIKKALLGVLGNREVEFVAVNKHQPMTVYPEWHPVRMAESLPRGRGLAQRWTRRTLRRLPLSRFDGCDLVVQCGAPVLWPGCHQAEWAEPIWREVIGRMADRVPVLNLAAGSCYAWEKRDEASLSEEDRRFVGEVLGYCRLTTARDPLAQRLYSSVGEDAPLVRCSALLAARGEPAQPDDDKLVLINYMSGAGHFDWGQNADPNAWEREMRTLVSRLKTRYRVAFLCHNQAEYDLAPGIDETLPRFLPRTPAEYWELARHASAAVCNRLHASVGMAGLGVPSVAIGTDTRMLMVDTVGLPIYYIKEANADELEAKVEEMIADRAAESDRLRAAQSETWDTYHALVSAAL